MLITLPQFFVVGMPVHTACIALARKSVLCPEEGLSLYASPKLALQDVTSLLDQVYARQVMFHFTSSSMSPVQAKNLTLFEGTDSFASVDLVHFDLPCFSEDIRLSHISCFIDRGYHLDDVKSLCDFCGQTDVPLFVYTQFSHFVSERTELAMSEGAIEATQENDASMFVSGDVKRLLGWSLLAHRLFSRMPLMVDNTLVERAVLAELFRTRGLGTELDGLAQNITDSMRHADENPRVDDPTIQEARQAAVAMMRLLSSSESSSAKLPHDLYAALKHELGMAF
jgi:hypothetical protein